VKNFGQHSSKSSARAKLLTNMAQARLYAIPSSLCAGCPKRRKEEVDMRKMFLVSCGLLFLLGAFGCAGMGVAPPPLEPIQLTGSANFTSKPFEINTKEWQINWKYKAKALPNFVLYVYPEGEKAAFVEMVKRPRSKEGSGSTYLYTGPGRYYIKVLTQKNPNWEVEVIRAGVSKPLTSPATFSGSTDTTTKPFKIRGKAFKITYKIEPLTALGYEGAAHMIALYPRGETESYIDLSTVGAGTGSRVHKGPGEYYLKVQCPMVKSWRIDVTE
jgi:hypothetical protein